MKSVVLSLKLFTAWTEREDITASPRQNRKSGSCSVVSDSLQPHGLYSPWNSPDKNPGVGSCSLLQGIFPTQGLNPHLPHCRQILYQLSHQGSPKPWSFLQGPQSRILLSCKCVSPWRHNLSKSVKNWASLLSAQPSWFCLREAWDGGSILENWLLLASPKATGDSY